MNDCNAFDANFHGGFYPSQTILDQGTGSVSVANLTVKNISDPVPGCLLDISWGPPDFPYSLIGPTAGSVELSSQSSTGFELDVDRSQSGVFATEITFDTTVGMFAFPFTATILPAVPEPATWAMLLIGFVALMWLRRVRTIHP